MNHHRVKTTEPPDQTWQLGRVAIPMFCVVVLSRIGIRFHLSRDVVGFRLLLVRMVSVSWFVLTPIPRSCLLMAAAADLHLQVP